MPSDQDTVYIKKGNTPENADTESTEKAETEPTQKGKGKANKPAEKPKAKTAQKAKAKPGPKPKAKAKQAEKTNANADSKPTEKAKPTQKAEPKPADKAKTEPKPANNAKSKPVQNTAPKPAQEVKAEPADDNLDETIVRPKSTAAKASAKEKLDKLPDTPDERPESSTKRPVYEIGDKIANRYQLVVKLGSGGTSDVYKARDLLLEGEGLLPVYVAIKILNRSNEDFFNVIRGEVIKTRSLDHPNIVRIHDFNYDKNTYFIVMELLEGEPLDEIIKRSRPKGVSIDHTFYIAEKIASALKYTHRKGIIHSDLKPANIYLTKDNEVKIYDFGVARHFEETDDYAAIDNPNPELEDNFTGYTPAYASAELIEGHTATVKDDIYSFACIIHEMLSSEHPYDRVPANKAQQQNKKPKKIPGLSKAQWSGLEQALSLDPAKRTKTIDKLFQNLFENNNKKHLLIGAGCAAAALVLAISIFSFNNYSTKKQLVSLSAEEEKRFTELMDTPKSEILAKIPNIKNLDEPQKSVFIQGQREKIIAVAKETAENVVTKSESGGYLGAIKNIELAQEVYPDSHALFVQKEIITKSFAQRRSALIKNLQLALVQPTFDSKEVRLKINELSKELAALDPSFVLVPDAQANKIYEEYTQVGLDAHLFDKIVIAKELGKRYFPKSPAYQALLAKGNEYLSAADNLYTYQTEVIKSPGIAFPDAHVRVLFSEVLKSLLTNTELVENGKGIEPAHKNIASFLDTTPLTPTVRKELRSQLFSSYLYLGSTFTAKGLGEPARLILEKAQEVSN